MALVDKYFSGSENLSGIDLRNLVFKDIRDPSTNYIDSGAFGDIYYVLDKDGKENKDYVVKVIRKHFFKKLQMMLSFDSISGAFSKEVDSLDKLKGRGIGPELVYANFKDHYYIIEHMDITLYQLALDDAIKPSQILKLVALSDRYLISDFYHDDMHLKNVMWSNRMNDFRIIDWGISLIIDKEDKSKLHLKKEHSVFYYKLMNTAMIYTLYKLQKRNTPDKEAWVAIQKKISDYIKNKYPDKVNEYDVFSPNYKYKHDAMNSIRLFDKRVKERKETAPRTFMGKVKREFKAATGMKGGTKKNITDYNYNCKKCKTRKK